MVGRGLLMVLVGALPACSVLEGVVGGGPDIAGTTVDSGVELPEDFLTDQAAEGSGTVALLPPAELASESSWCWTLAHSQRKVGLFVTGMDSGTTIRAGRYGDPGDPGHVSGLAYDGTDRLVFVGYDQAFVEIDLTSATLSRGPDDSAGYAQAVSTWNGEFLVLPATPGDVGETYVDYPALLADTWSDRTPALDGHFTRHAVAEDTLYGAWHSTDTIDVVDLATGALVEQVELDGFDGWVNGISVAGGYLHVLGNDRTVHRFELDGTADVSVFADLDSPYGVGAVGLWCDSAAP